jgi:hypothetical protein
MVEVITQEELKELEVIRVVCIVCATKLLENPEVIKDIRKKIDFEICSRKISPEAISEVL